MATAKCGYWEVRENANSTSFLVKLKFFNYICYEKSFICILIQCFKILILSIIFYEDLNCLMKTDFVYLSKIIWWRIFLIFFWKKLLALFLLYQMQWVLINSKMTRINLEGCFFCLQILRKTRLLFSLEV